MLVRKAHSDFPISGDCGERVPETLIEIMQTEAKR